jgi:hypothetical protein
MNLYRSLRRNGCQGDRKTIQRYRETLATGLEVSLLLRPTTEKGFGVEMARESAQIIDFSCREETPRDIGVIRLRSDVFEIDADVGGRGDGDEGQTGRVREIEFESAGEFRAKVGLAEFVVNKAYLARWGVEIAPQQLTQHSARDNETLLIALESKTCTPGAFIRGQGLIEASGCFRRNVQTDAPAMNFVGRQLKRTVWWRGERHGGRRQLAVTSIVGEQSARFTGSAIATSTSRGPSKRSLACAVRTLSTSIRSPACHRSRAVFAS